MDPPAPSTTDGGEEEKGGGRATRILFRCCFSLVFSLTVSFILSFVLGLLGLAIGRFTASASQSLPSTCRILSSGLDIRSSKICELGMLNYKAKQVFYPIETTRFRCRYDYYWASVFEVEYKELVSSQMVHAVAEVPKEALPEDCRPDFGAVWLTRMKFKVNETYNCSYTPGSQKADIYSDKLFDCAAKEPSIYEMIRTYLILSRRSFFGESSRLHMMHAVAGIISGMLLPICLHILIKCLSTLVCASARKWNDIKGKIFILMVQAVRVILLVVYICGMGWLALHFSGLRQSFFNPTADKSL